MKTRLSGSQAERNHSEGLRTSIVIGLSFRFCLRLYQSSFHWIICDGVISGIKRKWKRSDSSADSDSLALMTSLTTLIFYFHLVVSDSVASEKLPDHRDFSRGGEDYLQIFHMGRLREEAPRCGPTPKLFIQLFQLTLSD